MFIKKITNPIYKELKNLRLINNKDIKIINTKTRDKKMNVYQDKKSKIIFLEKFLDNYEHIYSRSAREKNYKVKNSKLIIKKLNDDYRRSKQFQKYFYKKDILDFGCGFGNLFKLIKNPKSLSGVEVREKCKKYIKKTFKKVEIHSEIKEINKKFDTITLFHVLEHLPDQIKILKNIKSKLKKKGKIIIEVPHANDFLLKFLNTTEFKNFTFNSSHLILHTSSSLKKILQKSGFKDVKISYFQRYNFANTLYWLLFKKPGGHEHFKHYSNKDLDFQFSKLLIKNKITDTIIATAKI